jgi:hypothetical protein
MKYIIALIVGLSACDKVVIYDPPTTVNRVSQPCTTNQQCPFPTICAKYTSNAPGVCQ